MGKLSILGAQRVKALTEILNDKEREALEMLKTPSRSEIKSMVEKEYGLEAKRKKLDELMKKAQKVRSEINEITGDNYIVKQTGYGHRNDTEYGKRISELTSELVNKKIEKVKDEFRHKKQQLWLCETLEEAKELVGINI